MQRKVEKTTKGFQFVRKNKSKAVDAAVSRTRLATTKSSATASRRSSITRGRSARRSLLEWEKNPHDFLLQFHEDIPLTVPAPARLEEILKSCVEHALRDADPDDLKAAGGSQMIENFSDMYIAHIREKGYFARLTGQDCNIDSECEPKTEKEAAILEQIAAYKAAKSRLENEKVEWERIRDSQPAKPTIAEVSQSVCQEAFLAGRLDVGALPNSAVVATETLLLQIDELHHKLVTVEKSTKKFASTLDSQADGIMRTGSTASPRHTISSILDPPRAASGA